VRRNIPATNGKEVRLTVDKCVECFNRVLENVEKGNKQREIKTNTTW
jgi:hypothetical protein